MSKSASHGVLARPGDAIGILGGGQLGRMLALAGCRPRPRRPHLHPGRQTARPPRVAQKTWVAPFDDRAALREFAASIKVATIEFENVPVDAVDLIEDEGVPRAPQRRDARARRTGLPRRPSSARSASNPRPSHASIIPSRSSRRSHKLGGSGVLKSRFSGYDGKGRVRLQGKVQPFPAWAGIGPAQSSPRSVDRARRRDFRHRCARRATASSCPSIRRRTTIPAASCAAPNSRPRPPQGRAR